MWRLLKETVLAFLEDEVLSRGAAIAFYAVTSLAPVLLLVIAIAGLAFGEDAARGAVLAQLTSLMGPQTAEVLNTALASASSKSSGILATIVGVGTLLATASGVFGEMQAALNRIWKAQPKAGTVSRLIRARAASLGLVAALGFLLAISLLVSAALTAFGSYLNARLPFGEIILSIINVIVSLALLSVLFAAIYKVLPDRPIAWRDVLIGAFVTAILFTIGKGLIGWYLGSSAVASSYGAAGGLIVLLFWVYYSTQVFLLGAEFTKVYAVSRGRGPAESKPAAQGQESLRSSPPSDRGSRRDLATESGTSPLQRAERKAAHHRVALEQAVGELERRLSPRRLKVEMGRRVRHNVRHRPLQMAAALMGAATLAGLAVRQVLHRNARLVSPNPRRQAGTSWPMIDDR
jgi:membrane protein